jgi:tetratricopeptide (TPR) repeat protein
MNRIVFGSLASVIFLAPAGAFAQTQAGPAKNQQAQENRDQRSRQERMYEDIEIMRRLLNERLVRFYGASRLANINLKAACARCHQGTPKLATFVDLDNDGKLDQAIVSDASECPVMTGRLRVSENSAIASQALFRHLAATEVKEQLKSLERNPASEHRFPNTEGTYVKGHGVVFTVTLPPPSGDPRAHGGTPASRPEPASDWDRVRRDVRQEKPAADATASEVRQPSLADIILRVLADNGHHFTQLRPDESISVAVTFRANAGRDSSQPIAVFQSSASTQTSGSGAKPAASTEAVRPGSDTSPASTWQDYVLLGDLHMRQNKAGEAIKAYLKALELKPEPKHEVTILQQLERSFRQSGRYPEAQLAEKKAKDLFDRLVEQAKSRNTAESKPTALPAKLIIAASKALLDAVGSGKMSFEEFRKAASVEYLTFSGEKK